MSDAHKEPAPPALRRQVIRFAKEYLPHLVLDAMLREGLLDPAKTPDRFAAARALLDEAAKLVGTMEKGPFVVYTVTGTNGSVAELGEDAIGENTFESAAEREAFFEGLSVHDGWTDVSYYDKRAEAEAHVREARGESEPDEFDALTEGEVMARMGWNADTVSLLRRRYIDEDRHKDGTFENWIKALAREEESECQGGTCDEP